MLNNPPTINENTRDLPIARVAEENVHYRDFGDSETYELKIQVVQEPEGDYLARAVRLPDVYSHGATIAEAVANVTEVFWDVARSHLDADQTIPWQDPGNCSLRQGTCERWVLVDLSKPKCPNVSPKRLADIADQNPPPPEWYEGEETNPV